MTAITAATITFRFLLPPPPPCRARLDGPAPITGIGAVEGSDAYQGPDDLLPPESLVTQGKVPTRKFRHKRSCYTHPGRRPSNGPGYEREGLLRSHQEIGGRRRDMLLYVSVRPDRG
jgi:hypothetical protein